MAGEPTDEKEAQNVHPLDWKDDFGPLTVTRFTDFVRHLKRIEAAPQPGGARAIAAELGYRDESHFGRVRATFLKYYGRGPVGSTLKDFAFDEPGFSEAARAADPASAALRRANNPAEASSPRPRPRTTVVRADLTDPEEGVSMDEYATLCALIAAQQPSREELARMLATKSMDLVKWDRVNRAWIARMQADPTLTLNQLFARAYATAGAGHFASFPPPQPIASPPSAKAPAAVPSSRGSASGPTSAATSVMPVASGSPSAARAPGSGGGVSGRSMPPGSAHPEVSVSPELVEALKSVSANGTVVMSARPVTGMMPVSSGPPPVPSIGEAPIPLERFAEIGLAMSLWASREQDTMAMLADVYQMSPADLSNVSLYWHRRFEADAALLAEYVSIQDALRAKVDEVKPPADLHY